MTATWTRELNHRDGKSKAMAEMAPTFRRDRPRLPAAARRRQIIDVATRLIADRGFWGVSMQDIADRCGLTVPGLLRHMESKVGLLIAVLEHRDVEDARSLRSHLGTSEDELPDDWAAGGPAGVDLRRLCAATMQRNATQPEIVRLFTVLAAESLEPTHPAHTYFARRQEQAAVAYAALAGHVTDQPELLARQILAMMDGLQMQWLRNLEATDLVREWEAAAEALFARFTGRDDDHHPTS
jgi:AcrR family transcriptional regulator